MVVFTIRVSIIVRPILWDNLFKKSCACALYLHASTTEEQQRMSHAEELLEMIENDLDFVGSIIAGNESWVFTFVPVRKWQIVVWVDQKSLHA